MPSTLLNLVAWTLIFVQGLVAVGAGQTLCIPFRDCGHHPHHACQDVGDGHRHGHAHRHRHDRCGRATAAESSSTCGDAAGGCTHRHDVGGGCAEADGRQRHDRDDHHHSAHPECHDHADHRHGLFGGCGGGHAECGCHLHVALPDAGLLWCPIGADAEIVVSTTDVGRIPSERGHRRVGSTPPRWIDAFHASDEIKARATTRLLV